MKNRSVFSIAAEMLSLISQLGIIVLVCIFGCFFVGKFIDSKLNTKPIFTIIFLVLGVASGFNCISISSQIHKREVIRWMSK